MHTGAVVLILKFKANRLIQITIILHLSTVVGYSWKQRWIVGSTGEDSITSIVLHIAAI